MVCYLKYIIRLEYPSCFFTVILIGLNKFATLLPIYWLAGHRSRFDVAWQTIGGKGMDFRNQLKRFLNKKRQSNSPFFRACRLKSLHCDKPDHA